MSRKETTKLLTRAVTLYLVDRGYSVHTEIGIKTRRRLDVLSVNYKGHIIGIEVKSGLDDYRSDVKWRTYLPYVNKLYFCFPIEMWEKNKERLKAEISKDAGIMIVETISGMIRTRIVKAVNDRELEPSILLQNCIKMAWRGGESCAHHIRRASKRMMASDPYTSRKKRGSRDIVERPKRILKLLWSGVKR